MKLALEQMPAELPAAQREAHIEACIAKAAEGGADLVLFPELAREGYGAADAICETAVDAEALAALPVQRAAERHGIAIVLGMAVRAPGGALANAAVLFRPGARPLAYAKRHLYGAYEHALFQPGEAPSPLAEWRGLRLGLLVCFDVEFPERVRELAKAGADLVLVPTALPHGPGAAFIARSLVPTRAFENGIFLAYADHCGRDARFAYQGLSVIAAPDGSVLAAAGERDPQTLQARIDPGAFAEARRANPYLAVLAGRGREVFQGSPGLRAAR